MALRVYVVGSSLETGQCKVIYKHYKPSYFIKYCFMKFFN